MERLLSPRDMAKAIGVSESSLKRWADEGLLQVSRTAGGHRRIELREALRYIRQTGTPLVRPEAIGLPVLPAAASPSTPLRERESFLVDAILRGNLEETRGGLIARYLAGDSVASLCDGPLHEALEKVGELWEHDPHGIHIEHRATDTCIHALNYLRGFLPRPLSPTLLALGGGPEGDFHLIPSLMAATVLASEGWRDLNLGPNLPAPSLMEAMRKFRPRLVWISVTNSDIAEARLRELTGPVHLATEIGASFVGGGRAMPARGKLPPPPFQILPSMQALAGFARGLVASLTPEDPKLPS